MNFKPLSKKYQFDDTLAMDFPVFLHQPLAKWLYSLLTDKRRVVGPDGLYIHDAYLTDNFREALHINFRESFPSDWNEAINFILADMDRTTMMLQWCLNNYANGDFADRLEWILGTAGSGYAVLKTDVSASEYAEGVYDLVERVPTSIKQMAEAALNSNDGLLNAWRACYGRSPNYNEAVQICQNVLEQLLRDTYLPKDAKAQLGKLITDVRAGKTMSFKGSNTLKDPNSTLNLIENVPQYRGMHKAGTGKDADKQIAEYVLLTTIYLYGLHDSR